MLLKGFDGSQQKHGFYIKNKTSFLQKIVKLKSINLTSNS